MRSNFNFYLSVGLILFGILLPVILDAHETDTTTLLTTDRGYCTKTLTTDNAFTIGHCLGLDGTDVPVVVPFGEHEADKAALHICEVQPSVGDAVSVQGFPGWTGGAGIFEIEGKLEGIDTNTQEVYASAPAYQGMSGGALIDLENNCVFAIIRAIALNTETHNILTIGVQIWR